MENGWLRQTPRPTETPRAARTGRLELALPLRGIDRALGWRREPRQRGDNSGRLMTETHTASQRGHNELLQTGELEHRFVMGESRGGCVALK
jgi:hypothetical protein